MGPLPPPRRCRRDDPQAAVDALLAEAQTRADAFAGDATPARSPTLDGARLIAAMKELAEIEEIAGRAGTYVHLAFSVDTADPAIGALLQRVEEKGTAIETALLFFHLEWAALDDATADDAARDRRARLRPPPPRHRAPLPAAPAERARGADPHREVRQRPLGLGPAVRGADRRDQRRPAGRRRARRARGRAVAPVRDRPRDPPRHRRARHRGAPARAAHARLHLQHAARGQDDRRPAAVVTRTGSPSRNLSNEASDESVQALIEAVRAPLRDRRAAGTG